MKFSLRNLTVSTMSDQNRVSPNNTNTLSCRHVMRIQKIIN